MNQDNSTQFWNEAQRVLPGGVNTDTGFKGGDNALIGYCFTDGPVRNFAETQHVETGGYLAPSQFEAVFISSAHSNSSIDYTCEAIPNAVKLL